MKKAREIAKQPNVVLDDISYGMAQLLHTDKRLTQLALVQSLVQSFSSQQKGLVHLAIMITCTTTAVLLPIRTHTTSGDSSAAVPILVHHLRGLKNLVGRSITDCMRIQIATCRNGLLTRLKSQRIWHNVRWRRLGTTVQESNTGWSGRNAGRIPWGVCRGAF